MQVEYVLTGYAKFDSVIQAVAESRPGRFVDKGARFKGDLVVLMSMHPGVFEAQQRLRAEGRPFLFLDHAYWQRGHDRKNYRVVPGDLYNWAQLAPHPDRRLDPARLDRWGVALKPWRLKGDNVLAIEPAPNVARMLGGAEDWLRRTARRLSDQYGLPVVTKTKLDGPLGRFLDTARMVVSFASAADVEAVCAGVPGVFSKHSAAHVMSVDDPYETRDRTDWAVSLAWQQFHVDELRAGLHWPIFGY